MSFAHVDSPLEDLVQPGTVEAPPTAVATLAAMLERSEEAAQALTSSPIDGSLFETRTSRVASWPDALSERNLFGTYRDRRPQPQCSRIYRMMRIARRGSGRGAE